MNDAAKGKIHHSNLYFVFLGLTCCAGLFFIVWFGIGTYKYFVERWYK